MDSGTLFQRWVSLRHTRQRRLVSPRDQWFAIRVMAHRVAR
jgi:hypothetical protein